MQSGDLPFGRKDAKARAAHSGAFWRKPVPLHLLLLELLFATEDEFGAICNLPTEVLELVLKETGGKEELKKNCFVSQRFRDITQAMLIKKVTVRYNDVVPITKLFVLRKDLAKSLQYLTVNSFVIGTMELQRAHVPE
ncbi:hypothetical protein SLS55_001697 [Diplodia seriata]|uniref:F-box domain-containing protein n=1 Tax=Diplodia seriata TaxID=420778 RepID=A0ABR3CR44_9PEZI